jgi:predicted membrane protein
VLLITSLAELAIGLSIAGSLKATIMTLLAWTTAGTLVHGIGEIALAFLVRGVGRNVASRR